jgi:hypothetical protein
VHEGTGELALRQFNCLAGRRDVMHVVGACVGQGWPAQPSPLPGFRYQPTMQDVDPGIDHGNSDASVPYEFKKQLVFYRSQQLPGTIIIDTRERYLYLIQDPTHAMRYGIGVDRDGFTWQGLLQISRKAEWPDWHPPPEMIERQPYLPRFMAGGPGTCDVSRHPRCIEFTVPMHRRQLVNCFIWLFPTGQRRRRRSL